MLRARLVLLLALVCAFSVDSLVFEAPVAQAKTRRRRVNYTVKRGDTLIKIARRYHVSTKQLKRWNRLKGARIYAGQRLRIRPPKVSVGKLVGGVQLPKSDAYYLKDRKESWAHPHTADVLMEALRKWRAQYPKSVPIVIGDISLKQGGWFPPHVSHQTGYDIDIGLFASRNRGLTHFPTLTGKDLDAGKTWAFVEALVNTGQVELILLNRGIQRQLYRVAKRKGHSKARLSRIFQWPRGARTRAGLIRHSRGHDDHLHVRIKKKKASVGAKGGAAAEGPRSASDAGESLLSDPAALGPLPPTDRD